jgi:hypothetical protein
MISDMRAGMFIRLLRVIALLGCSMAMLPVANTYAEPDFRLTRQGSVFLAWEPLDTEALDRLRGGYVDLSGIKISFGLERMVWINGELMQSLALTVPDLASLRKGSIGAVSVQGSAPAASLPVVVATQPVVVSPASPAAQATQATQSSPAPASTAIASGGSTSAVLPLSAASVVQNGPGNIVMPEVLKNLGPGVFTVVQNSLNGQTIQGLTVVNAQVSGLGSILRNNTFLDLHLTLRGAGR